MRPRRTERRTSIKIIIKAVAGTLESSDALIEVSPGTGVALEIESAVLAQFGDVIEACVREVLASLR